MEFLRGSQVTMLILVILGYFQQIMVPRFYYKRGSLEHLKKDCPKFRGGG